MTGQPYLPAGPVGTVPPALLRRRTSVLTWVSMIVLGVGALLIALVIFLTGGPAAAIVTTLLAAVSFPLLIAICFWLDRYEPEPTRYRIAALGWGAVIAVVLSFFAEQLLFAVPGTDEFIDTAITAPLVEEFGKGLFLVAILVFRRQQVHGLLDGIVYAALVGIGFAFVEDILYYTSALNEGGGVGLTVTFFLRGVMGPFAHPLFTSATGIGFGIAAVTRRPVLRWLAPVAGYLVAVLLHGTWNGSGFWGSRSFFLAYAAVMLPLLVVVVAVAVWARVREGRMLTAALEQTAQLGWNPREEIRWVARLSDRISSRGYARRTAGPSAARALRAYQQTWTEIAFLHLRALDGTAPPDLDQRMGALLQHAADLRPYIILPPPAVAPGPYGGGPSGGAPYGGCPLRRCALRRRGVRRAAGRRSDCSADVAAAPGRTDGSVAAVGLAEELRRSLRRAGRRTNAAILLLLVGALLSGGLLFAAGTPVPALLARVGHGLAGVGLVVLVPWKTAVIWRASRLRLASVALLALVLVCLVAGFVQVFGGYGHLWGLSPIQVHVGAALLLVVLLVVHVVRHWPVSLRRSDLTRRRLLTTGAFTLAAGATYGAAELVGRLAGSPAATRLATGSHRLSPADIPATIWLFDRVPVLDAATHQVVVAGRPLGIAELEHLGRPVPARLDCTSGWYAEATWTGVALATLLDPDALAAAASVEVRSVTGYTRRFPVADAPALWLATRLEGRPLSAGQGAPVRLVAPGRRGFWWVKWVATVELSDVPPAAQPPFPLQ